MSSWTQQDLDTAILEHSEWFHMGSCFFCLFFFFLLFLLQSESWGILRRHGERSRGHMGKARNAMGILLHPVGLLTDHLHFSLYSCYRTYDCKLFFFGSGEEYCGRDLGKFINEKITRTTCFLYNFMWMFKTISQGFLKVLLTCGVHQHMIIFYIPMLFHKHHLIWFSQQTCD